VVPVIVGIASGDRPSPWQLAGIASALVGVFLASREPGRAGSRLAAGVGLALLAALGFGGYFPPMHAAGNADYWWASLLFRMTSSSVILAAVAVRRPSLAVAPVQVPILALIGTGDMLGNLLFAAASSSGLVSITSVLASLYPIVTVVLARILLAERVARSQEAGIGLTLAGVALISTG
jgi:drug/metabolite transporter (DMT)-like permease